MQIVNAVIIMILLTVIAVCLWKSRWLWSHMPVRKSRAIAPDYYTVEKRLHAIATETVARSL